MDNILNKIGIDKTELSRIGYYCDREIPKINNTGEREIIVKKVDKTIKRKKKKNISSKVIPITSSSISYEAAPNDILLPAPFSYLFIAKAGEGKSTLLLNMIDWYSGGYFDNIFILSPTFNKDVSWIEARESGRIDIPEENFFDSFKIEEFTKIIRQLEELNANIPNYTDKTKTLFIFDDIIAELPRGRKNINKIFKKLIYNHRHLGISYITISQEYVAIPTSMRRNAFGLCLFGSEDGGEREGIIKQNCGLLGRKLFTCLWDTITSEEYCFLYINRRKKDINNKYHKNFEKSINIDILDEDTDDEED